MQVVAQYIQAFFELFFPRLCKLCYNHLYEHEEELCHQCLRHLPRSGFELVKDNPVHQMFWGRAHFEKACALYYYRKGENIQDLMHQLKYRGHRELGKVLGKQLGQVLLTSGFLNGIEVLMPVPLHPRKLHQRGFNQAEQIALGMSEASAITVNSSCLYRTVYTSSQTRKGRYERWQNVSQIFALQQPDLLSGKHVLLIDDVVTTGSTLEACYEALKSVPDIQVSVATLGYASL
jgi:ComF family protein